MSRNKSNLISEKFSRFVNAKVNRLLVVGVGLTLLLGGSSGMTGPDEIQTEVKEAFGLSDGSVVSLDLDRTPGISVSADITIDGNQYTFDLHPHSIRTKNFVLKVQLEDGSYVEVDPGTPRTLKGSLLGSKGSRVVGSMLESGLAAKIVMGDGREFFIEPMASRMAEANVDGLHVVYQKSDVKPHPGRCGVGMDDLRNANGNKVLVDNGSDKDPGNGPPEGGAALQVAEVAVDADFEYFSDYGSVSATMARMELIISTMNLQYESQVGITHVISGAVIRSSPVDPYTTTNASDLLDEFMAEWVNNQGGIQRDVAHLFTGKEIAGGTIGIGYLGVICNIDFGYSVVQSDFNGNFGCATDLSAHELGHNWDAGHCNCASHTMNPSITCANNFRASTISDIVAFRNSIDCLDDGKVPTPPPNDEWTNSIEIADPDFAVPGSNVNASIQASEQQLVNTGSTVWWNFDADLHGSVTIDTIGSSFDTQLHIFTGSEMGFSNLVPVVNNDDLTPGVLQSEVTFDVIAGQRYEIRVGGYQNGGPVSEGSIVLNGDFTAVLSGDINCDGTVNLLDVSPFIALLSSKTFNPKADMNLDGEVNLLDVSLFIELLSGA